MLEGLFAIYSDGIHVDNLHARTKCDAISKARTLYKLTGYIKAIQINE